MSSVSLPCSASSDFFITDCFARSTSCQWNLEFFILFTGKTEFTRNRSIGNFQNIHVWANENLHFYIIFVKWHISKTNYPWWKIDHIWYVCLQHKIKDITEVVANKKFKSLESKLKNLKDQEPQENTTSKVQDMINFHQE